MGVTAAMYAWGMQYENPSKPYDMEGYFNAPNVVEALEFIKKCMRTVLLQDTQMLIW